MKRQLFIGDVQGCFDEFLELVDVLEYDPRRDELYLTGDVINRGPKSAAMLDYLMERPRIRSVLGNHEKHLLSFRSLKEARKHAGFARTAMQLSRHWEEYLEHLAGWPAFIDTRRWTLVHAGLLPGLRARDMDLKDLVTLREVEVPFGKRVEKVPWFELYRGRKLVVFGHWALRGLVYQDRVRGLDTGCVYGGSLSALVLPDDRIVSVKARRRYYDTAGGRELW